MSVNLYNKETKELTQVAGNAKDIDAYTKAETDDLLDEKADIDNFETYSTTETKIGTWIDGKPIYRKVFVFETYKLVSQLEWTHLENGEFPINMENIIHCYGLGDTGTSKYLIGTNTGLVQSLRNTLVQAQSQEDVKTIIWEYTKSTDA